MAIQTPYMKVDEYGFDLIRNYQVYKHIDYLEISSIKLSKGYLIRNWQISLLTGLLTITGALLIGTYMLKNFDAHFIETRNIQSYLLIEITPWLLLAGGLIIAYQVFRRCKVLTITTTRKTYKIAVKELENENKMQELIEF